MIYMGLDSASIQLSPTCALVIVDMQNAFVHQDGFMKKMGFDTSLSKATINPIKALLAASRRANVPIIFTRLTVKEDHSNADLLAQDMPKMVEAKGMVEHSWDNAIVNELKPREGETIIDKTSFSAFFKTKLLDQLEGLGVDQIILTGVTTNVCVKGTGRDAYANDIKAVIVSDGTGAVTKELHEGASASTKYGMGPVVSTADVVKALEGPM